MKMFALGLDRQKTSRGRMMIEAWSGLGNGKGVENWDNLWVTISSACMAGVLLQVYRPDIGCKTPELQVSAGWA